MQSRLKKIIQAFGPNVTGYLETMHQEVVGWPGITLSEHAYGGIEFQLGGKEVGHYHSNGWIDIPFSKRVKVYLVRERKARSHPYAPKSGYVNFVLSRGKDLAHALWLLRVSYLYKVVVGRMDELADLDQVEQELITLELSDDLRRIFARPLNRWRMAAPICPDPERSEMVH